MPAFFSLDFFLEKCRQTRSLYLNIVLVDLGHAIVAFERFGLGQVGYCLLLECTLAIQYYPERIGINIQRFHSRLELQ